jgi:hypothetical protein
MRNLLVVIDLEADPVDNFTIALVRLSRPGERQGQDLHGFIV